MTETEYLRGVAQVLEEVENAFDEARIPADCALSGLVLTIEFDDGGKIVLNAQTPTKQLWMAARSGGMHFVFDGQYWTDLRTGVEFFEALSRVVGEYLGREVDLRPT